MKRFVRFTKGRLAAARLRRSLAALTGEHPWVREATAAGNLVVAL